MKIGLVGNQNSGKTTLFNCLTGMNSKIGNWPGVTIEKKVGTIIGTNYEIVDLPGVYSLSPYSIEENVTRNFIINEKPDIIINIIDATCIERSLYLTTQLIELDCKVILALNMVDILENKGIRVNIEKLEKLLKIKVVKISALKKTGIKKLIQELNNKMIKEELIIFDSYIEQSILKIADENNILLNKRFIAIKLLEEDENLRNYNNFNIKEIINKLKKRYCKDLEEVIAEERYKFIEKVKRETVAGTNERENLSDKLDKIFLNKWLAFPIFVIIMFLIYYLSVGFVGNYTVEFVERIVLTFKENIKNILIYNEVSEWINSLIVNGIIEGVGAVIKFVPQLIILFISISLLETTGYMSRISFLLDSIFRKVGLNGKSIIPFIIGSGCSVPGIMSSKIIEDEEERKMTAILTPFIPCSAKLPIIILFTGYFFPNNSGLISASLYFLAIVIIIFSALLIKKFIYNNTSTAYVSELPEYKLPSIKYIARDVLERTMEFIKRAGTTILLCSIAIWFLLSFSFNMQYCTEIDNSILASIGNKISWIFVPIIGCNSWEVTVSAIQGLIAKEQVISSMSIINGISESMINGGQMFSETGVYGFFTASSAYAFILFNLFSAPCFGAISAMKKEIGGVKQVIKVISFQTIIAWILSTITYQISSKIEKGNINIANILLIITIMAIIILIIKIIKEEKCNNCKSCEYCRSFYK